MPITDHAWTFLLYAVPPGDGPKRLVNKCYVDADSLCNSTSRGGYLGEVVSSLTSEIVGKLQKIHDDAKREAEEGTDA